MEMEESSKLPFLDVLISPSDEGYFKTSIYRKSTFTGLFTNFMSFIPFNYKVGLVKTLVHRIYEISSSWSIFDQEIINIKEILKKNSFPPNIIDKEIKSFLDKKSHQVTTVIKKVKTTCVIINYHT